MEDGDSDDAYADGDFDASCDDAQDEKREAAGGASDASRVDRTRDGEDELRPPQRSSALRAALLASDDGLSDGDDAAEDDDDDEGSKRQQSRASAGSKRASQRVSGRHLLDNSLWAFAICATRVRALQIPVTTRPSSARSRGDGAAAVPPAIRELRVFATLDKQAAQSRGSEWKREPQSETPRATQRARGSTKASTAARSAAKLPRRSGLLDEAKWRGDHGKLQWTLPMEKFRRLKATSPRIKVLVFGIGENAVAASVSRLSEESAHAHSESIVSCGWFFLDLRTPDLPEKWFKLQNARFGGEILISTSFAPFEAEAAPAPASTPQTPTFAVVEDGEHLRLGSRGGSDVFVLSVLLQAALNVAQVVEATLGSRHAAQHTELYTRGFWLSYSLFDVVVRTDVFHDLEASEFLPIRDSFRVLSCVDDLADFLAHQTLAVYLCTYGRVLAGVEIPLSALLAGDLFTSRRRHQPSVVGLQASIEGNFAFPSAASSSFIDASVVVECVSSATAAAVGEAPVVEQRASSPGPARTVAYQELEEEEKRDAEPLPVLQEVPERPDIRRASTARVSVDHIRINCDAVERSRDGECIELELSAAGVARSTALEVVRFRAFTKSHAIGDCDGLVVRLEDSSLENLQQSLVSVCCRTVDSHRVLGKSQPASLFTCDLSTLEPDSPPRTLELPFFSATGGERIGECVLRVDTHESDNDDEEDSVQTASKVSAETLGGVHVYRVFLQLKALREFEQDQELSIAYLNPFTGKGRVEIPGVHIVKRSEVRLEDAFCVFELLEDEQTFKQCMQSCAAIDFFSQQPSDRTTALAGTAMFSMNFLFFSQEQFCCAALLCGRTFSTRAECEAHWETAHHEAEPEEDQLRAHLFKSCSVDIPVISNCVNGAPSSSRRIGVATIVAYAEDMGVLSADAAASMDRMLSASAQRVRRYDSFQASESKLRSDQRCVSAPDAVRATPSVRPSDATRVDRPERGADVDEVATAEARHTREIALLKQSLEQEKQRWLQEQQLEQTRWKRRCEAAESNRMQELEEEWAQREEERSSLVRAAQTEYERLEKALRASLVDLEARERRLAVAESAVQREQQTQREENELVRRRLQSEQTHALSLAHKQSEALETRVAVLERQLSDAEKRARLVEADFAEYRLQQRKVPESRLREEISALKGSLLELEKQKLEQVRLRELAEANASALTLQLERMARVVQSEKKKNEARVAEELEKLRVKYVAREEKYVLDGDREELRAIKKQLDELRGWSFRRTSFDVDESPELPRHHRHHQSTKARSRGNESLSRTRERGEVLGSTRRSFSQHRRGGSVQPLQSPAVQFQAHDAPPSRQSSSSHHSWRRTPSWPSAHRHQRRSSAPDSHSPVGSDRDDIDDGSSVGEPDDRSFDGSSEYYEHDESDREADVAFVDEDGVDGDDLQVENDDQLVNASVLQHQSLELERLERERKLLLASGAYDEHSYLVRELTRLISLTRSRDARQSSAPFN